MGIDKNSSAFNLSEFIQEQYRFNIIFKNLDSLTLEMYSDEENYIIYSSSKKWPTWIWAKDNFDIRKIDIKFDGIILPYPAFKKLDIDAMKKHGIKHYSIYENFEEIKPPGGKKSRTSL